MLRERISEQNAAIFLAEVQIWSQNSERIR